MDFCHIVGIENPAEAIVDWTHWQEKIIQVARIESSTRATVAKLLSLHDNVPDDIINENGN